MDGCCGGEGGCGGVAEVTVDVGVAAGRVGEECGGSQRLSTVSTRGRGVCLFLLVLYTPICTSFDTSLDTSPDR